jgi:hypothetical protein
VVRRLKPSARSLKPDVTACGPRVSPKIATACVFLDWHRRSTRQAVLTAVAAWGAVHAYTGAVFVTLGVFVTALLDPLVRRERALVRRNLLVLAAVVVLLQLPYLVHQMRTGFRESAMGAVTGSIGRIATGSAPPQLATSVAGYVHALDVIQVAPVTVAFMPLVVVLCGVIVSVRYRRDTAVLMTVLLPQVAAIVGYGLFLGALDAYYYLSLTPAAVAVDWRDHANGEVRYRRIESAERQ